MSTPGLLASDFAAFFREVHGDEPFPWQRRLAAQVAEEGRWPEVLDLPTGSGKTAALDVAVFHLALEADRGQNRRAPVRIAFVVDRRLIVDDAFARAQRIAEVLAEPGTRPVAARVAARLQFLSGGDRPLLVRRLRGGLPHETDWALTPVQPTILCSTVDQVGSRLLFRGYGLSDRAKPLQAGLLGSDCHIFLDEAHVSEPFRQTLEWVRLYHGPSWRRTPPAAPWGVSLLTATPDASVGERFRLSADDDADAVLSARLRAAKPARLVGPEAGRPSRLPPSKEPAAGWTDPVPKEERERVDALAAEALEALQRLRSGGTEAPAVGVVANRVARARGVYERLRRALDAEEAELLLLIGPAREVDRRGLAHQLDRIRTGVAQGVRRLERPLVLVSTQCIEVGVDIDLDGLVSELAPVDALQQRFGRLNRAGRPVVPYAAVLASRQDLGPRANDRVYGGALTPAWAYLLASAAAPEQGDDAPVLDFGPAAMRALVQRRPVPTEARTPKPDAPILLPAHLDLLSQTTPVPTADPDVALYLHGADREPASVSVLWRADLEEGDDERLVRRRLQVVPPRAGETVQLPLWAVRRWLRDPGAGVGDLADVAEVSPDGDDRRNASGGRAFRWRGDDDESRWVRPDEMVPGDTLVVPSDRGGLDAFGWNPLARSPVQDVAAQAAAGLRGRTWAVRVAPGLLAPGDAEAEERRRDALAEVLAAAGAGSWKDLLLAVRALDLPAEVHADLAKLDHARRRAVTAHTDLYGADARGRPRGVIFVARLGLEDVSRRGGTAQREEGALTLRDPEDTVAAGEGENVTENDARGSFPGVAVPLQTHSRDVELLAERFGRRAGLPPERVADLKLAGSLHDAGKADPRFQALLAFGDPLAGEDDRILAKSARTAPPGAARQAGLPPGWRHEALSVRLALRSPHLAAAGDPELVLWLIGTHHGWGRPFFPAGEDDEPDRLPPVLGLPGGRPPAEPGPQSLAFDWQGLAWADLYARLKERYGVWELARMEAILRLADHRASEAEAAPAGGEG